jgi:hypothetical protein
MTPGKFIATVTLTKASAGPEYVDTLEMFDPLTGQAVGVFPVRKVIAGGDTITIDYATCATLS